MSQVKATNLVTSDGAKTGTVADIIDSGNKTKLFSPFSLGVLAATDGAAFRTSITAAKSGANSDITELNALSKQIVAQQGGVSPGYIEGLTFRCVVDNTVVVSSGAAYIPFAAGGRVVTFNSQTINFTTGTSLGRVHLWLGEESGVGKIFTTEAEGIDPIANNYWGTAYKSLVVDGRRYIGSLLRGTGGNILRCYDNGSSQTFYNNAAGAPFIQINSNTSQSVQTLVLYGIAPATLVGVFGSWTVSTNGPTTRIAPSAATCGFTVSTSVWQYSVGSGISMYVDLPVGDDGAIQFISDAGTNVAQTFRVNGYTYRR